MPKLTKNKRKWVIKQFLSGRSATPMARVQKISRVYVYKLVKKFKKEGELAYEAQKSGRSRLKLNPSFVNKVIELRKKDDYGKEKIHHVLRNKGFFVSVRQIQKILDEFGYTEPCPKRRGQRKYVRYEYPISNYMWHCDWSFYEGKWYMAFIDDKSRKIMAAACFDNATEDNAIFLLYQAILTNQVCPVIVLSDKGPQFYNSKKNKKGEKTPSLFEKELQELGIDFWTSRRKHPQTNGKQEKWFDTLKTRFRKHPEDSLEDVVNWYNKIRIHQALNYKTPEEVYWANL